MTRAALILIAFGPLWMSGSLVTAQLITFDELPFQPVDGVSYGGVSFEFRIDGVNSTDAYYASYGPGELTNVSDPSLTGNAAGILRLQFAVPTPILEFGVALSTADSLTLGLTVTLLDASAQTLLTAPVNTASVGGNLAFSEAKYTYHGTPLTTAILDFADTPDSFALDNLAYQIPEPATSGLGIWGLAFLFAGATRCAHRSRSAVSD